MSTSVCVAFFFLLLLLLLSFLQGRAHCVARLYYSPSPACRLGCPILHGVERDRTGHARQALLDLCVATRGAFWDLLAKRVFFLFEKNKTHGPTASVGVLLFQFNLRSNAARVQRMCAESSRAIVPAARDTNHLAPSPVLFRAQSYYSDTPVFKIDVPGVTGDMGVLPSHVSVVASAPLPGVHSTCVCPNASFIDTKPPIYRAKHHWVTSLKCGACLRSGLMGVLPPHVPVVASAPRPAAPRFLTCIPPGCGWGRIHLSWQPPIHRPKSPTSVVIVFTRAFRMRSD